MAPKRSTVASKRIKSLATKTKAPQWTFLTNHAHVILTLAMNEGLVLRKIADQVGITERAVQNIIAELADGGFIKVMRVGRRNQYRLNLDQPLRHSIEKHRSIGDIVKLIVS